MTTENQDNHHNPQQPIEEPAKPVAQATLDNLPQTQRVAPQRLPVMADQRGIIAPKDLDEAWRYAVALQGSGMLPTRYDNPGKVLCGMQYALELGLKPLTALRQIAIIEGTPNIFGDLPLAIVMASGELEDMDEYWTTADGTRLEPPTADGPGSMDREAFAAYCMVKRKGRRAITRYYNLQLASEAKLYPDANPRKPWARFTRRMLKMRARSEALKDAFPERLSGIGIGEYDHSQTVETHDEGVTTKQTTNAEALAQRLNHNTIDAEKVAP